MNKKRKFKVWTIQTFIPLCKQAAIFKDHLTLCKNTIKDPKIYLVERFRANNLASNRFIFKFV